MTAATTRRQGGREEGVVEYRAWFGTRCKRPRGFLFVSQCEEHGTHAGREEGAHLSRMLVARRSSSYTSGRKCLMNGSLRPGWLPDTFHETNANRPQTCFFTSTRHKPDTLFSLLQRGFSLLHCEHKNARLAGEPVPPLCQGSTASDFRLPDSPKAARWRVDSP